MAVLNPILAQIGYGMEGGAVPNNVTNANITQGSLGHRLESHLDPYL